MSWLKDYMQALDKVPSIDNKVSNGELLFPLI